MWQILFDATYDTIRIVFTATIFTILIGSPIGLFLEASVNEYILRSKYHWLHKIIISTINFLDNTPLFLLLVFMIPIFNQLLSNYFTIELSAVITLIFIGVFSFAKDLFKTLSNIPKELSETAIILGAEPRQILTKFLLPEAMPNIIKNIAQLIINLIGLSIITSALGVGGLGKLALEKSGYNELENLEISYIFCIMLLATSSIYMVKLFSNYIINSITIKTK